MCVLEGSLRLLEEDGLERMELGGAGNSSQGAGEREMDVRHCKTGAGVRQRYQFEKLPDLALASEADFWLESSCSGKASHYPACRFLRRPFP